MTPPRLRAPAGFERVNVWHSSMQFSDPKPQQRKDAERLFVRQRGRKARWGTGTELGDPLFRAIMHDAAERAGYRLHVLRDAWVAVDLSVIVPGSWREGYEHAVDSTEGDGRRHTDKGVVWASWEDIAFGRMTVGAAHYLTHGRPDARSKEYGVNLDENRRIARVIGEWAREHGRGKRLVFFGGDQNIVDRHADTFLGEADLTSTWDELGRWENTGHGNIDVLATYDNDGRVVALDTHAVDDSEFHLFTDHFLVEGALGIRPLKARS